LMNSEIGDVVGPLETARGYTIVKLLAVASFDSSDFQNKEVSIYSTLINKAQVETFNTWLTKLKAEADIIDNRKYYY